MLSVLKNELQILMVNLGISILRIMYIRALVGGYLRKYPVGKRNLEIYRLLQSEKLFKQSILQLKSDQTERLLNKPYVNEVHLTGQNLT